MSDKIKNIIIGVLILLVVILIGVITFLTFREETKTLEMTGTVIVVDKEYVIIEYNDNDYLISNIKGEYKTDDVIKVTYKESKLVSDENPRKLTIIDEELIKTKEEDKPENINNSSNQSSGITNNNSVSNKPNNSTSNNNVSGNNNSNTNTVKPNNTTSNKNADSEVLNYFNTLNNEFNASSIKDNVKSSFITVVDFLFYNGKIKGYTFKDLSDSAKLKVLSMALYFDGKIEKYFPGYKESITNTANKVYTNIKEKVVKTYIELTTTICSKNNDLCKEAKEGFNVLKNTFSLSWALIKDIAGDGISSLKNWYEIWSGK